MGFFKKLFEKKECDICGGEIGLLGNRKLEDGNCCKECARKLSPWFDERRHSTVDQIKEQIAYREKNAEDLKGFLAAQVIGEDYKMYVEEKNGIPTRFFVTNYDSYMDENPDIISFGDVLACTVDVQTYRKEMKKEDSNGNSVSYNPPRYETDYDFYIDMQIGNNPYFDDIRFRVNEDTVTLEDRGISYRNLNEQRDYQRYMDMCQQIEDVVKRSRMTPQEEPVAEPEPEVEAPVAAPATPTGPKFCPNCGAPCDGGKFCQSCGSKL